MQLRLQNFFSSILKVCLDFLLLSFFFRFGFLMFLFAFFHPTEYFSSRTKLNRESLTSIKRNNLYKIDSLE